jgi:hypothetical protein
VTGAGGGGGSGDAARGGGDSGRGDSGGGGDLSREDLVREFGEPGVANPNVIDLITPDPDGRRVFLVMMEPRGWGSLVQLKQLEEKINRYLGYVLDGYFADQYPDYRDLSAVLRLDCAEEPPAGEAAEFLEAAGDAVREAGLELVIQVIG